MCNDKLSTRCRSDTGHFSKEHLGTSHQEQYNNSGQTFSWQTKSRSGQIKQVTFPIRMAHASKTILLHRQNFWSPQYRSFCVYPNQTITQIQQFVLGSGDRRGGRVTPKQLVYRSKFCQSALQNVTSSHKPHLPNKSRGYHYCASLASPDLGKAVTQNICASTPEAPETKTNVYTMPRLDPRTNEKQQVGPLCLDGEWEKHLTKLHWPQTSIVAYKYFLSQSTLQQYDKYLECFRRFCCEKYECFPPPAEFISCSTDEFLTLQSKKSNRPESLLRGSLAALSNYFEVTQGKNLISHEIRNLVKALIKSETKALAEPASCL